VPNELNHPRSLAYWSRVSFSQTEPLPILIPCSIAWWPARFNSAPPCRARSRIFSSL
jgi:hypothetical protein